MQSGKSATLGHRSAGEQTVKEFYSAAHMEVLIQGIVQFTHAEITLCVARKILL